MTFELKFRLSLNFTSSWTLRLGVKFQPPGQVCCFWWVFWGSNYRRDWRIQVDLNLRTHFASVSDISNSHENSATRTGIKESPKPQYFHGHHGAMKAFQTKPKQGLRKLQQIWFQQKTSNFQSKPKKKYVTFSHETGLFSTPKHLKT